MKIFKISQSLKVYVGDMRSKKDVERVGREILWDLSIVPGTMLIGVDGVLGNMSTGVDKQYDKDMFND